MWMSFTEDAAMRGDLKAYNLGTYTTSLLLNIDYWPQSKH